MSSLYLIIILLSYFIFAGTKNISKVDQKDKVLVKVEKRKSLPTTNLKQTFNVTFEEDVFSIKVLINTDITEKITCRGTVELLATRKTVLQCFNDVKCGDCESFTVDNLKPNTYYGFKINGSIPGVRIHHMISTKKFYARFDVSFIQTTYSIEVIIITNITRKLKCTGNVLEKGDTKPVFDCVKKKECKMCEHFAVTGLKSNTEYIFNIKGNFDMVKIQKTVKTDSQNKDFKFSITRKTFSLGMNITSNRQDISNCTGNVKSFLTNEAIFECSTDKSCSKCQSFTIGYLLPNTEYLIDIKTNSSDVYIKEISRTRKYSGFYNVTCVASSYWISVMITTDINDWLKCHGGITSVVNKKTVFQCDNDENCKSCESFDVVQNIQPSTLYQIAITGNMPVGINCVVNTTRKTYQLWLIGGIAVSFFIASVIIILGSWYVHKCLKSDILRLYENDY